MYVVKSISPLLMLLLCVCIGVSIVEDGKLQDLKKTPVDYEHIDTLNKEDVLNGTDALNVLTKCSNIQFRRHGFNFVYSIIYKPTGSISDSIDWSQYSFAKPKDFSSAADKQFSKAITKRLKNDSKADFTISVLINNTTKKYTLVFIKKKNIPDHKPVPEELAKFESHKSIPKEIRDMVKYPFVRILMNVSTFIISDLRKEDPKFVWRRLKIMLEQRWNEAAKDRLDYKKKSQVLALENQKVQVTSFTKYLFLFLILWLLRSPFMSFASWTRKDVKYSISEILLFILSLCMLGVVGYYGYQWQRSQEKALAHTDSVKMEHKEIGEIFTSWAKEKFKKKKIIFESQTTHSRPVKKDLDWSHYTMNLEPVSSNAYAFEKQTRELTQYQRKTIRLNPSHKIVSLGTMLLHSRSEYKIASITHSDMSELDDIETTSRDLAAGKHVPNFVAEIIDPPEYMTTVICITIEMLSRIFKKSKETFWKKLMKEIRTKKLEKMIDKEKPHKIIIQMQRYDTMLGYSLYAFIIMFTITGIWITRELFMYIFQPFVAIFRNLNEHRKALNKKDAMIAKQKAQENAKEQQRLHNQKLNQEKKDEELRLKLEKEEQEIARKEKRENQIRECIEKAFQNNTVIDQIFTGIDDWPDIQQKDFYQNLKEMLALPMTAEEKAHYEEMKTMDEIMGVHEESIRKKLNIVSIVNPLRKLITTKIMDTNTKKELQNKLDSFEQTLKRKWL